MLSGLVFASGCGLLGILLGRRDSVFGSHGIEDLDPGRAGPFVCGVLGITPFGDDLDAGLRLVGPGCGRELARLNFCELGLVVVLSGEQRHQAVEGASKSVLDTGRQGFSGVRLQLVVVVVQALVAQIIVVEPCRLFVVAFAVLAIVLVVAPVFAGVAAIIAAVAPAIVSAVIAPVVSAIVSAVVAPVIAAVVIATVIAAIVAIVSAVVAVVGQSNVARRFGTRPDRQCKGQAER